MKNLKLLSKLQASDMVTLLLKSSAGERLDYYILAKSINYSIVSSGQCDGSIDGGVRMFNISLSSLLPMIEKGYDFRIKYSSSSLEFVSSDERVRLTPLCVEYNDATSAVIIEKFLRFVDALSANMDTESQIARLENEIKDIQREYDGVSLMHLSGEITSSNPFGEDTGSEKIDTRYSDLIASKRERLDALTKKGKIIKRVSLKPFKQIALAAARSREMLSFCEGYAITSLKSTYILQRGDCPVMAVHGPLMYQLINYGDGESFYWFENGLVFSTGDTERTTVFMEKYLPNTSVDSSIALKGVVQEKYTLSMKGILAITQLMKSKFPRMTFDMGDGKLILENDKNETIITQFDVEEANTVQLKKIMRGEDAGDVTMAKIKIPPEVQSLLSMFRDKLIIYIKERKIVFQADTLYLVFGR